MKKLFVLLFLLTTILVKAQDTPPSGVNFKAIPSYSFKYYTPDSTVWMYKGTTYGWTNLKNKSDDSLRYYRLLNNHDSLSKLQEKSYHSLVDTPNLGAYAKIDNPTFTTKITTPALNIPTSAAANYFWKCTDAGTGAGTWAAISASQLYKGTVDGDDGVPTVGGSALIDGTGTAGWFYVCVDAGTYDYGNPNGNSITLALNDQIHYNGSVWQKVPAGTSQWVTTGSDIYYNTGNVGIGTVSPASALEIGAGGMIINNGDHLGFKTSSLNLDFSSTFSAARIQAGSGGSNLLLQPSGGNVGIGTTNAAYLLDILKADQAILRIKGTTTSGSLRAQIVLDRTDYVRGAGMTIHSSDGNANDWFYGVPYNGGSASSDLTWGYHASQSEYIANAKMTLTTGGALTVISTITASGGNSGNWNDAYAHSQIAGGNSVHVSVTENTQWDAAYTHSQIAGGNSVHVSVAENSNWDAAYSHTTNNSQAHTDYLINNGNDATSGSLTATNFILSSDRRLKKNITPIKKAFDIKFVQFNLKSEPDQLRYGVIAQDVEKYYPELVRTDASGTKSVAYIDLLIGKIHELEQRIEQLEKANELNENRYKAIKNK